MLLAALLRSRGGRRPQARVRCWSGCAHMRPSGVRDTLVTRIGMMVERCLCREAAIWWRAAWWGDTGTVFFAAGKKKAMVCAAHFFFVAPLLASFFLRRSRLCLCKRRSLARLCPLFM